MCLSTGPIGSKSERQMLIQVTGGAAQASPSGSGQNKCESGGLTTCREAATETKVSPFAGNGKIVSHAPETNPAAGVIASPKSGGIFMDNYEIRVLSNKQTDGLHDGHAVIRRALAIANAAPVIIEVWCGSKCVYAGALGEIAPLG